MNEANRILSVEGLEILDSRGNPTVMATITLANGIKASAASPSGASTGMFEAHELRDGDENRYNGKGVMTAVTNVSDKINKALMGKDVTNQRTIDEAMINLDGTQSKSKIGANAILSVSLAAAKAAAKSFGLPLYRYIGGVCASKLPMPMMNILNGGAHAANNLDIQEFMIVPVGAKNFPHALRMGTEVFHSLGKILKNRGLSTGVGDEGGYAPDVENAEEAIKLILEAADKAGFTPGKDIMIALDVAASEWYSEGRYILPKERKTVPAGWLIDYYSKLCTEYPVCSIEDPLAEDDFSGVAEVTKLLGHRVQIVGDDLFVTNKTRLQTGIDMKAGNAILIKPNQIGTLTETLDTIAIAQKAGYRTVISHRSGETEDTTIADIAVAVNAGQIKTGAPSRSERVAKYNRLLRIDNELNNTAQFENPFRI